MRQVAFVGLLTFALSLSLVAKPRPKSHGGTYMVGTVAAQGIGAGGRVAHCANGDCISAPIAPGVTHIQTDAGVYSMVQPSVMIWNGPPQLISWFVSDLHPGDKVVFAASCSHGECIFWVPEPGHPEKEIKAQGGFRPSHAKSNTEALCGAGKLSASDEAQVCPSALQSK